MESVLKSNFSLSSSILLDTLRLSKLFKEFGFSEEQADVLSEVTKLSQENHQAMKQEARKELEEELNKKELVTRHDLKQELRITKQELGLEIEKSCGELELKIEQVRGEIQISKIETIKWMIALLLAQTGLIFTLLKFVPH